MLNKDGITKNTYAAPVQILADVDLQYSIGCRIQYGGTDSVPTIDGKRMLKAGTPINVNIGEDNNGIQNKTTSMLGAPSGTKYNAILLHDVDMTRAQETKGYANGTALLFGIVNLNRVGDRERTQIESLSKEDIKVIFVKL